MIDKLKNNIKQELVMLRELNEFFNKYHRTAKQEKRIYAGLVRSLINRMRLVNESIPLMLENITLAKKLPGKEEKPLGLEPDARLDVLLKKANKDRFLKELNISEKLLSQLKKKRTSKKEKKNLYKKPTYLGKISNKMFLNLAESLIERGKFKNLTLNIRKTNINVLAATFISIMFFSVLISFFVSLLFYSFFVFFEFNFGFPILSVFEGNYFLRMLKLLWIPTAFPLITYGAFYLYPGAEKKALAGRIDQELPFVVIHMGSISGSKIEPLEILKIIGLGKEYKYAGQEVRKILNQTNIYGYDLSTALRNVSLSTPSAKFSELLNGMSVTINSGGDMRSFFDKRAESLLLEYRLEREKNNKSAETFMDLYISVVIATPMILLIILIMIAVSGIDAGFSAEGMSIAVIGIVAIVNVLFLTFLHLKQPNY